MRYLAFAIVVCLALPLAASAQSPAPYEVYAILDLTGPAAFVGKAEAQSLEAMEGIVNRSGGIRGRPVHFVVQDGQSNPVTIVQLFNEIAAKNIPIVIGPSIGADCLAVVPLIANGPVSYCLSNAVHPPAGSYMFSALASSGDLAIEAIRYYRSQGWKRIASLDTTDASGKDGDTVIAAALALPENKDVRLVAAEHFNPSDISVAAQLTRIKAAGAQALIGWATGSPFGTLLRGLADGGYDLPVITHAGNVSTAEMEQFAAFLPRQLYLVGYRFLGDSSKEAPAIRSVQNAFTGAFRTMGVTPDVAGGSAWDATLVAISALRTLGTNATPRAVRDYIENLHDFPGIDGLMDFRGGNQRGLNADAALIVRWDAGRKQFVAVTAPGGRRL
jgi:branched-chain amino acid transport system substrate-binding protein